MNLRDFSDIQHSLVKCQELLDDARQNGWSVDLLEQFKLATRELHEGAIVARAIYSEADLPVEGHDENVGEAEAEHDVTSPEVASLASHPVQEQRAPSPPVNRLLTPEEKGESTEPVEVQVDLISSIGEMTLAEKLALQPLLHVAEGLSIVDRAQFTSVLFSGKEELFSQLLSRLDRASTQEEALSMFEEIVQPRGETEEIQEMKDAFAKRIVRTFVS